MVQVEEITEEEDAKSNVSVDGAGGVGKVTNGSYSVSGTYNGRPKYRQVGGSAIIFFAGEGWRINYEDATKGWYYSVESDAATPPQTGWTCEGYEGGDAEPPPKVHAASEEAESRSQRWRQKLEEEQREEEERVAVQFKLAEEHRLKGNKHVEQSEFDEALEEYAKAEDALVMVGNLPESREKEKAAQIVIQLNKAHVYLKSGKLQEAKQSCDMALVRDGNNAKALYRRGLASARIAREASLFQEAEALRGLHDFEELLKLDPSNKEAKRELQQIKADLRDHDRDLLQKQRDTWGQVFGGKTESDEPDRPDVPLPAVRAPTLSQHRRKILTFEQASVPSFKDVLNLELSEGWCTGFCGLGVAERQALVELLEQRNPKAGRVVLGPKEDRRVAEDISRDHVLGGGAGIVCMIAATGMLADISLAMVWLMRIVLTGILVFVVAIWVVMGPQKAGCYILRMASPCRCLSRPSAGKSIEEAMELAYPKGKFKTKEEVTKRAKALLQAAGFQVEEMKLAYGKLDPARQHLIDLCRCLASKPEIVIFDDPFGPLEVDAQARVLRMLKRMKQDCKTCVVYLSDDLDQQRFLADTLLHFSREGALYEMGPIAEVLENPRHPETKLLMDAFRKKAEREGAPQGDLRERYEALLTDAALGGAWIPRVYI